MTDAPEMVNTFGPELNRAHMRDVIHYEPDHDGIMPGRDWPEYAPDTQIPAPKRKTSVREETGGRSEKVMSRAE